MPLARFSPPLVYFPLARTALILEKLGINVDNFPLSQYRHNSFYVMRNDALDRFGTRLEKRFSKKEIQEMMERGGLEDITFSTTSFWTAVGTKIGHGSACCCRAGAYTEEGRLQSGWVSDWCLTLFLGVLGTFENQECRCLLASAVLETILILF